MSIKPYKQSLTHSCLVACFLMLLERQADIVFTETNEQEIALKGSRRIYPFYVVGIPMEIAKKYGKKIQVYVDNKYFTKVLKVAFAKEKSIEVVHTPIKIKLIRDLLQKSPLICHIDDNVLGDYSHSSHFIILENATKNTISIIDPWMGTRKRISDKTLIQGIHDLKTQVKMCPLLFSIDL
ncbi:MAG: hypothetical protein A2V81_00510 [Candidatus Abawacabacteria bacterium RBG_16_42_10]|uniref:Peptidase C39 domain-containing protein n=1 Tax=Candidatus Abawacabacteria bacterium RBG_16_42_10 TaxID=1817814 RepID=A0A1F4XKR6_9BACT|nr:MAG: hypothetical protein A2V81_00510 [Candidatus Abawacabacteria bacterium RBG_16_42_10]